jgi:hypothetical protein
LLLTIRMQTVAVEDYIFGLEAKLRAAIEHYYSSPVTYFITYANQLYIAAESYK